MKKNLKLLSKILMISFICNYTISSSNINFANARHSRKVVVNATTDVSEKTEQVTEDSPTLYSNSTDGEAGSEETVVNETESGEETTDETLDEENGSGEETTDEESDGENEDGEETTDEEEATDELSDENTVLSSLNSDKNLKVDDIVKLVKPLAYSISFNKELNSTFPDFNPLRELAPDISIESNNYLDVNSNEIKSYVKFFSTPSNSPSDYSDQNTSNMLIKEANVILKEISDEINKQPNSTIFSLLPTVLAFSDTLKILSNEYNSILTNNFDNQIKLNILLKNVEKNLYSLLDSMNKFKTMLPDSIEMLNKLIPSEEETTEEDTTTDEETTEDDTTTDEESTEEDTTTDEESTEEDTATDEESTEEDTTTDEESTEDDTTTNEETNKEDTATKEETNKEDTTTKEESNKEDTTTDEESTEKEKIDPKKVILYFGQNGQELTFNEKNKKYYEIDPEDPDQEELIEYSGEVSKMTLEEYLNIELYFDEQGNELIYDKDTNSYFLFNTENEEFSIYEGKVTKMKMKDILEKEEGNN